MKTKPFIKNLNHIKHIYVCDYDTLTYFTLDAVCLYYYLTMTVHFYNYFSGYFGFWNVFEKKIIFTTYLQIFQSTFLCTVKAFCIPVWKCTSFIYTQKHKMQFKWYPLIQYWEDNLYFSATIYNYVLVSIIFDTVYRSNNKSLIVLRQISGS